MMMGYQNLRFISNGTIHSACSLSKTKRLRCNNFLQLELLLMELGGKKLTIELIQTSAMYVKNLYNCLLYTYENKH